MALVDDAIDTVRVRATTEHSTRRFRLVPPAITPIRPTDLGHGVFGELRGIGRDRFRHAITTYLDAESTATYTSFRRALGACLHTLSDESAHFRRDVLIPAFCSSDFPDAIDGVGLESKRYDIDPANLAVDIDSVVEGLESRPVALVVVNVLGYGSRMDELVQLCQNADVYLIEALGYSLGTEYQNTKLGTFGDGAVLNFQQGKPIPVGGGMIVNQNPTFRFDDEKRPSVSANIGPITGYSVFSRPRTYYLYDRLKAGFNAAGLLTKRATTHPEGKFDVDYNAPFSTISDFQGAIAHRVFERHTEYQRHRERTAMYYREKLAEYDAISHLDPIDDLSNVQFVRYPILAETEELRDRMLSILNQNGIHATMLYDWPVIDAELFPGAAHVQRRILTVPTHPFVDSRDRRTVVEKIRTVLSEYP